VCLDRLLQNGKLSIYIHFPACLNALPELGKLQARFLRALPFNSPAAPHGAASGGAQSTCCRSSCAHVPVASGARARGKRLL
jgi:hypothetical protein